jgi:hypothetical protein
MSVTHDKNSEHELPMTRRSRDEDWHERAKWEPTAEEFQKYLEREIVMAKANIANIARDNLASSTLHSSATITRAQLESGVQLESGAQLESDDEK